MINIKIKKIYQTYLDDFEFKYCNICNKKTNQYIIKENKIICLDCYNKKLKILAKNKKLFC